MNRLRVAIALVCVCLAAPSLAQVTYGLTIQSGIYTVLPTTDLGGGGSFSESSAPIGPVEETSDAIPAYGHADSVEGRDPSTGALYTARASSSVNFLAVSAGALQLSIATAGGISGADLGAQGNVQTYQVWQDTLTISGLPTGAAATLLITDRYQGNIKAAGASVVNIVHQMELDDISCQRDCTGLAPYETFTGATSVDSRKQYRLRTRSGDTVTLFEYIGAELNGSLQWQSSASFNNVEVFIDPVEAGAVVRSASHLDYSTPKPSTD